MKPRSREQEALEDMLAILQHIRSEATVGEEQSRTTRQTAMAETFSRIGYLASWVQFQESARWHGMEAKYHEQA